MSIKNTSINPEIETQIGTIIGTIIGEINTKDNFNNNLKKADNEINYEKIQDYMNNYEYKTS